MTRRQRIHRIHDQLQRRRSEVLARYRDELARADEEAETREVEEVERAAEQWDVRVLGSLGEADRRVLAGISAALERLARGSYGICQDCGGRIEHARLTALPEAATCIGCAHEAEPLRVAR